jgi:MFS family permease
VLFGLLGVGETLVEVAGPTLLQRAVPDRVLARVFGALESLLITAVGVGAILTPLLIGLVGVRWTFVVTGAVLPVLAALLWKRLTAIDLAHPAAAREIELLRGVPIFAPLPEGVLEQLAAKLIRFTVPAGQDVFRQGDRGDRFYVIADGTAEVVMHEGAVASQGAGGYFGEIALVRDVPRTATVRAGTDLELYALERDDFIAAVTGHAPSAEAADAVVATRLRRLRPTAD